MQTPVTVTHMKDALRIETGNGLTFYVRGNNTLSVQRKGRESLLLSACLLDDKDLVVTAGGMNMQEAVAVENEDGTHRMTLSAAQVIMLVRVHELWRKPLDLRNFYPSSGQAGWVEGWIGGNGNGGIYIGVSPEGQSHS